MGNLQTDAGDENKGRTKGGGDNLNILEAIGSVVGNLQNTGDQNGGGIDAASLLQGLSGLVTGGQNGQGGLDPSMIGSLVNMFSQAQTKESDNDQTINEPKKNKSPKKAKTQAKKVQSKKATGETFDIGNLLALAQGFLGDKLGSGK